MANDPTTPEQTQSQVPPRRLIAAPWHTLSILLIFAYLGFRTGMPSNTVTPGSAQPNASHNAVLLKYALLILSEWGWPTGRG